MNPARIKASPLDGATALLDAPWNVGLTLVLCCGTGELALGWAMLMNDVTDGRVVP